MGSFLMSERSFPQFPSVEIPPMNSHTPVVHETILILPEKKLTLVIRSQQWKRMGFRVDGWAVCSAGHGHVTSGQVFNLLEAQFASLKNRGRNSCP